MCLLPPLAFAFVACAAGWLAINARSLFVFMMALVPAVFSLQFNFPILLALSGSLDDDGQCAAIATPLMTSGFAWAAIMAGVIVRRRDLAALGTAAAAAMLVSLLLLMVSRA